MGHLGSCYLPGMQLHPCPLLSYLLAVARDRGASTVSSRGATVGCLAGGATAVGSSAGGPGTCGGVLLRFARGCLARPCRDDRSSRAVEKMRPSGYFSHRKTKLGSVRPLPCPGRRSPWRELRRTLRLPGKKKKKTYHN